MRDFSKFDDLCTYSIGIIYGFFMSRHHPEQLTYKFMVLANILGIGLMPQALYRSDICHLLQVLPPLLIAGSILVNRVWQRSGFMIEKKWCITLKALIILYLLLLSFITKSVYGIGRDLVNFNNNPMARYSQLIQGVKSSEHPVAGYQLKPGQYNLIVSILRLSIIKADAHNGWKGLIPYIYGVSRLTSVAQLRILQNIFIELPKKTILFW